MAQAYVPTAGDLISLNLRPQSGHEQQSIGRRARAESGYL